MKSIFRNLAAFAALFFMSTTSSIAAEAKSSGKTENVVVGAGCFWCVEAVFERIPGVKSVESGYANGHVANPTYKQVCNGDTGHAEVAKITYDPAVVSIDKILEVFFEAHDPTTLNRQGADEGDQYRSGIYYQGEAQHQAAIKAKAAAQPHWEDPIVTEIKPLDKFYPAEDYHQDYYKNNPNAGYCTFVIKPKLKKLQEKGVISK